jgi:serine carboxypeptidase-like clade II
MKRALLILLSLFYFSVANITTTTHGKQLVEFDKLKISRKYVQEKQDPSVHRDPRNNLREQDKIVSLPGQT